VKASRKPPQPSRVALVLAGGAARGAYEVGVVRYVLKDLARELGKDVPIDIVCGTSVGAINACMLAAHADEPSRRADYLVDRWLGLRLDEMLRPSMRDVVGLIRGVLGRQRPPRPGDSRRGGLLDVTGIEHVVRDGIPFGRIREHMRAGKLYALTVSVTQVATGRTVIFVERAEPGLPDWSRDPTIGVRAAEIGADHALASAALPLLFPAVRIDGDFYCDGGLRQNVPLSPARRLGADRLLVVNPRYILSGPPGRAEERSNVTSYPGPLFLFGKALNALLLDRIDNDIDRLRRINTILEAGTRRYGPTFVDELNRELSTDQRMRGMRTLQTVHVRVSDDIGKMAAEYVRSSAFTRRASGVVARLLRRLAEWDGAGEADLLSYLLFDGEFASRLIELGAKDARARHDELCALFCQ
jgi:NTE family protein